MNANPHREVAAAAAHLARYLSRTAVRALRERRQNEAEHLWSHARWYAAWARGRLELANALDDRRVAHVD